jgi:membrane-bound ClpP family serine protease
VILLFYLAFSEFREELNNHSTSPLLTLINGQYFLAVTLTIAFIGLIIAYWKEGLGGGISLASYIVLFIGWSDFHVNFILGMVLTALPAILYFAYWLFVYRDLRKADRDQAMS